MDAVLFFPFSDYWWFYAVFTVAVLGLLALDLGVFHRQAHIVGFREALGWTVAWVALALLFAWGLHAHAAARFAVDPRLLALPGFDPGAAAGRVTLEFLTGYLIELSLSVDNIFVFVVVLGYFAIPPQLQHRVLFYGILGALVFRSVFIALGAVLMQFHWIIWVFGGFLILTGLKIILAPAQPVDPDRNPVLRLLRRLLPVTPRLEGSRFLVRAEGRLWATPLLVCLVFIELTDIVFAIDSVPAIFAITREPLLVFTSNVFAILGLRSMYFLLSGVMHRFRYLKYGLGAVLVFVGLKMAWLNEACGGKFPISWSLAIIAGLLGSAVAASLLVPARPSPSGPNPH